MEGKLYYIFCEGDAKETTYFYFFNKIASQIILQLVPIKDGKNSPMGLYRNACKSLIPSAEHPDPFYRVNEGDEVWFVIDTDAWADDIADLRSHVAHHQNWFVAQSNQCFEVWLYYHFFDKKPEEPVANWKAFLNDAVKGGFNNKKHPKYLETAIANAENNFSRNDMEPAMHSTEVFVLGKRILPLVKEDIDLLLP